MKNNNIMLEYIEKNEEFDLCFFLYMLSLIYDQYIVEDDRLIDRILAYISLRD
jgi:hypothetical protein